MQTLFRESAVGCVSHSRVVLYRYVPYSVNPFQWVFIGNFSETESTVVFSGHFTLHVYARLFLTVWFGVGAVSALVSGAIVALNRKPEAILALVALLGMLAMACSVIRVAKWLSRNDIEWLSRVIQSSLAEQTT